MTSTSVARKVLLFASGLSWAYFAFGRSKAAFSEPMVDGGNFAQPRIPNAVTP